MVHYGGNDVAAILPSYVRPRKIQPGKRTIMVSVLLSFLLLMSQLLRALQLDHPPKISNVYVLQSLTDLQESVKSSCFQNYLGGTKETTGLPGSCQHLPPSRGLCSLIQTLFFSHDPQSCDHQTKATFCHLKEEDISCEAPIECRNLKYFVGYFSKISARISWIQITAEKIQPTVIEKLNSKNHPGFVFIRCSNNTDFSDEFGQPQYDSDYDMEFGESYTQLFMNPALPEEPVENKLQNSDKINFNLLFVDSVSRNHFYRSLPKTIEFLESLKEKRNIEVLDYEYMQAVKQRTYESLEALFSGFVNVSSEGFGIYDLPWKPLPVEKLFSKFKSKGYRTLYMEDLCWNWEWGLVKDLKVWESGITSKALYKKFTSALKKASIDSIGLTLASCEILKVNRKKDPFHGLPSVCFNGKYQHEYILDYLTQYQSKSLKNNIPFITFTETNVGHEETGIRIQTLDQSFKKHLEFASTLENVVTIIFSDHGNTYGNFIQSSPEALIETFSPSLFFIIPKGVKEKIGDVSLRIMKDNQQRLVSLVDVHTTLLAMINKSPSISDSDYSKKYIIKNGLMANIPPTRTCNEIPLLHPNLCICRNFEVTVKPSIFHSNLAEFGLSVLNNQILNQRKHAGYSGFGSCQPLQGAKVRSVTEKRITTDMTRYQLDVKVKSEGQSDELFLLTVEVGQGQPELRLVSYGRISPYEKYKSCCDKDLNLKLCICSKKDLSNETQINYFDSYLLLNLFPILSRYRNEAKEKSSSIITKYIQSPSFSTKITMDNKYPNDNPCIITMIRRFKQGFVLYGANLCAKLHKLDIFINSENFYISTEPHSSHLLYYLDLKMLVSGVVANPKSDSNWNHYIKFY